MQPPIRVSDRVGCRVFLSSFTIRRGWRAILSDGFRCADDVDVARLTDDVQISMSTPAACEIASRIGDALRGNERLSKCEKHMIHWCTIVGMWREVLQGFILVN